MAIQQISLTFISYQRNEVYEAAGIGEPSEKIFYLSSRNNNTMAKLKITYRAVGTLQEYKYNARTHPEKQIKELAESIRQFGFTTPIIIDGQGEIIAGHGRYLAAQLAGLDQVPCIVRDDLSSAQKKALRLADNRIQLSGGWDAEKLSHELSDLVADGFDALLTGFTQQELDNYLHIDESVIPDLLPETSTYSPSVSASRGSDDDTESEGRPIPETDESTELQQYEPPRPKASDDDYSSFELVMLHENKKRLVEVLNEIRTQKHLDKLEDALMCLVEHWEVNG